MSAALLENAMTETYTDVEKLIKHTVSHFIKRHGQQWGTFDELFSHANESFMIAWRDYKPNRGASFSTWCRWVVSKNLSEHQRSAIYRERKCSINYCDLNEIQMPDNTDHTTIMEIVDELGTDARYVVMLTLNPPAKLQDQFTTARSKGPKNQRAIIRQYLHAMDWNTSRVNDAFNEIGKVLAE